MTRREFLKFAGIGAGIVYTGTWLSACGGGGLSGTSGVAKNRLLVPSDQGGLLGYYRPTGRFTLTAQRAVFEILPGKQTSVLTYTLEDAGKTYYNPILVLRKGDVFSVDFYNRTGEKSIIHWHGFRAPWRADGHPSYAVADGGVYNYPDIKIIDRSGTYFYHPHPHGRTGYQVYMGLASMIIIEDTDEDDLKNALDLSYGTTDIPLIIQDRTFDESGNLIYNPMGMNGQMGFWGETVLVNMTPNPYMDVERRIYRFRVLNGSNARPYRLVLLRGSDRIPFHVIGVEGGLLESPVQTKEILVAPGERIDILVDFRLVNEGDILRLYSLQHNLVGIGGGGMGGGMSLVNREFEVLEFRVVKGSSYDRAIPARLSTVNAIDTTGVPTENVSLGMSGGVFTINGQTWNETDPLFTGYGFNYTNGDRVIFKIINNTGMYHPMHFHGFQFQILSRSSGNLRPTDLGWKDTVIVGPHETVDVAMDMSLGFTPAETQYYLFHCHILEHHDAGMMVNFTVT